MMWKRTSINLFNLAPFIILLYKWKIKNNSIGKTLEFPFAYFYSFCKSLWKFRIFCLTAVVSFVFSGTFAQVIAHRSLLKCLTAGLILLVLTRLCLCLCLCPSLSANEWGNQMNWITEWSFEPVNSRDHNCFSENWIIHQGLKKS